MYQYDISEGMVKQSSNILFDGEYCISQQDSDSAHKSKTTEQWLRSNIPDFTPADDWPSRSPGLNPFDYNLFSWLDNMNCVMLDKNLESLKKYLVREAIAAVDQWQIICKRCHKQKVSISNKILYIAHIIIK